MELNGRIFPHTTSIVHGKVNSYVYYGCRCPLCREGHRNAMTVVRHAKRAKLAEMPDWIHGKANTYTNYMCRCRPCKDAHNLEQVNLRRRKKEALQQP